MASLMEDLISNLDTNTLKKMGQQAGIDTSDVSNAVQAALPAILAGLSKNTNQTNGAAALSKALKKAGRNGSGEQFIYLADFLHDNSIKIL